MPNQLIHETSPYLLQHAENPVDWYPWGEAALRAAREGDKPILLSVGYSACHWCHVMEHESFEDLDTASQMNRDFVNIKVDREERPDIDDIYMKAVQSFTGGHGGWPMTVFLTPAGVPFAGGTYFPPVPAMGRASFRQVLAGVIDAWRGRRDAIAQVGRQLVDLIDGMGRLPPSEGLGGAPRLDDLADECTSTFDTRNGGFGGAPKFPPSATLAALLAHAARTGRQASLDQVTTTLDAMARGGMHDLIGGGFARYSVDEQWIIPHFEKMLYDNAQLVPVYLDAFKLTGRPSYARIARRTLDFVLREMTADEGGFRASFDADSEGHEGRFYVWRPQEIEEIVGQSHSKAHATRVCTLLGVTDQGSFEAGRSVLRLPGSWDDLSPEDAELLDDVFPKLLEARARRVAPARDDKIVTAWNGLMISALARGAATLGEPRYAAAAAHAARFLKRSVTVKGRLQRTWKDGRAHVAGFIDDYVFTAQGLVDLYESTFEPERLRDALALVDQAIALFWDTEHGGFFYTGQDAETLIVRTKPAMGGAEPSVNGVAALTLLRLSTLTGRSDLAERAQRLLDAVASLMKRLPRGLEPEAVAAEWQRGGARQIGIVGAAEDARTQALLAVMRRRYLPFSVLTCVPPTEGGTDLDGLLPWMADRVARNGEPTAYVCQEMSCQAPVTQPEALEAQLAGP